MAGRPAGTIGPDFFININRYAVTDKEYYAAEYQHKYKDHCPAGTGIEQGQQGGEPLFISQVLKENNTFFLFKGIAAQAVHQLYTRG